MRLESNHELEIKSLKRDQKKIVVLKRTSVLESFLQNEPEAKKVFENKSEYCSSIVESVEAYAYMPFKIRPLYERAGSIKNSCIENARRNAYYASQYRKRKYSVGSETSTLHNLQQALSDKRFDSDRLAIPSFLCTEYSLLDEIADERSEVIFTSRPNWYYNEDPFDSVQKGTAEKRYIYGFSNLNLDNYGIATRSVYNVKLKDLLKCPLEQISTFFNRTNPIGAIYSFLNDYGYLPTQLKVGKAKCIPASTLGENFGKVIYCPVLVAIDDQNYVLELREVIKQAIARKGEDAEIKHGIKNLIAVNWCEQHGFDPHGEVYRDIRTHLSKFKIGPVHDSIRKNITPSSDLSKEDEEDWNRIIAEFDVKPEPMPTESASMEKQVKSLLDFDWSTYEEPEEGDSEEDLLSQGDEGEGIIEESEESDLEYESEVSEDEDLSFQSLPQTERSWEDSTESVEGKYRAEGYDWG